MDKAVFFIFLCFCGTASAQSIFSGLQLNRQREYKTVKPKKIKEMQVFYTTSGKEVKKSTKIFDAAGMLLDVSSFDEDDVLTGVTYFVNDTVNRIILESHSESFGKYTASKGSTYYEYDVHHFLVRITNKDGLGNTLGVTEMKCNDKGDPVEMVVYDNKGNVYGKETGEYLYDKNSVVTTVFTNYGERLSTDTITIDFTKSYLFPYPNYVYNEKRDLIKWISKNLYGSITLYEADYLYDEAGNCIEEKIYEITKDRKGKEKRSIERDFKKTYTY